MATNPRCPFPIIQRPEDEENGSVNERGLRHFYEEFRERGG